MNAQETYAMLGNENLWEAATRCHELLQEAGIPHSICGGVAVCLHGYQRNTVDLDLIVRSADSPHIKTILSAVGLQWNDPSREFRTERGIPIPIPFLIAGERAGKDQDVKLPDPQDEQNFEMVEGLPVLRLSRLIEVKLACGTGDLRRMHKDFADVVELIAIRNLDSSFARHLHNSLRKTFRELVKRARGEG